MHYIQENQYHVIFIRFCFFSMKNFAQIMYSLVLLGHIPTKNLSKSPPPPPFRRAEFSNTNIKYFCNIISWHTGFLPGTSFGGRGAQYLLFWDQVLDKSLRGGQKDWGGRLLPIVEERHHKFNLSIQSFCPVAFTCLILQFCLFRKDFFHLTCSICFWNFSHFRPSHAY